MATIPSKLISEANTAAKRNARATELINSKRERLLRFEPQPISRRSLFIQSANDREFGQSAKIVCAFEAEEDHFLDGNEQERCIKCTEGESNKIGFCLFKSRIDHRKKEKSK